MSKKKSKNKFNKLSANQNVQLLFVWTIFLGLIILLFHLIYKFIIKKLLIYILSIFGFEHLIHVNNSQNHYNSTNLGDSNIQRDLRNGLFNNSLDSKFQVSIGICYKNDFENIKKENIIQLLSKLSSIVDLFLFIQIEEDKNEEDVLDIFENNGIFNNRMKKHRVIFCDKLESIPTLARQLQANMHIDSNKENIEKLKNKVPNAVAVSFEDNGELFKECVERIESVVSKSF